MAICMAKESIKEESELAVWHIRLKPFSDKINDEES